jgi:hypothetical protein
LGFNLSGGKKIAFEKSRLSWCEISGADSLPKSVEEGPLRTDQTDASSTFRRSATGYLPQLSDRLSGLVLSALRFKLSHHTVHDGL